MNLSTLLLMLAALFMIPNLGIAEETSTIKSPKPINQLIEPVRAEVYIKNEKDNILSILSATTALVAVLLGPAVTIYVSKKQLMTPIKQHNARELKDLISYFLTKTNEFQRKVEKKLVSELEKEVIVNDLFLCISKIKMTLKNDVPIQKEIIDNIDLIFEKLSCSSYDKSIHEGEILENKVRTLSSDVINYILK